MVVPLEGCSDVLDVSAAVREIDLLTEMSGEAAEAVRWRAGIYYG